MLHYFHSVSYYLPFNPYQENRNYSSPLRLIASSLPFLFSHIFSFSGSLLLLSTVIMFSNSTFLQIGDGHCIPSTLFLSTHTGHLRILFQSFQSFHLCYSLVLPFPKLYFLFSFFPAVILCFCDEKFMSIWIYDFN